MKKLHLLPILLLLCCLTAHATHLKGGFISYVHQEGRTYSIILTIYANGDSPVLVGSNATLDFGDGTVVDLNSPEFSGSFTTTPINDQVYKQEMVFEHTYPGNGSYIIAYSERSRDAGIRNLENSADMPFYLESSLLVDDLVRNNSARPVAFPTFIARQDQTYHYNPKAFDPDGDSLSFHVSAARESPNTPAAGYVYPHIAFESANGSETNETASYSANPTTGDIIWDSPVVTGSYLLNFEIREWKTIEGATVLAGKVLYDFMVQVEEPSDDLQLIFPVEAQEVILEVDSPWETTIRAVASNPEDTVVLQLSGDFLQQNPELTPADSVGGKGEVSISIQFAPTEGDLSRYQLIAKAYVYSTTEEPVHERNRAAYLLTPGYVNGVSDLSVKRIRIYPNPANNNRFYIDSPSLNGKEVSISLFSPDGKNAFNSSIRAFNSQEVIQLPLALSGPHLLLIRQGVKLYTSRILLSQK